VAAARGPSWAIPVALQSVQLRIHRIDVSLAAGRCTSHSTQGCLPFSGYLDGAALNADKRGLPSSHVMAFPRIHPSFVSASNWPLCGPAYDNHGNYQTDLPFEITLQWHSRSQPCIAFRGEPGYLGVLEWIEFESRQAIFSIRRWCDSFTTLREGPLCRSIGSRYRPELMPCIFPDRGTILFCTSRHVYLNVNTVRGYRSG